VAVYLRVTAEEQVHYETTLTLRARSRSSLSPSTHEGEFRRLRLGIARALERRAGLRVLLVDADVDIAARRKDLRRATARASRALTKALVPTPTS
jgi:hypothetical protein